LFGVQDFGFRVYLGFRHFILHSKSYTKNAKCEAIGGIAVVVEELVFG
jgi:hypothetical protein